MDLDDEPWQPMGHHRFRCCRPSVSNRVRSDGGYRVAWRRCPQQPRLVSGLRSAHHCLGLEASQRMSALPNNALKLAAPSEAERRSLARCSTDMRVEEDDARAETI